MVNSWADVVISPVAKSLATGQRVFPTDTGEATKVEIGSVDFSLIFNRQRRDVGVGGQWTSRAGSSEAGEESVDVSPTRCDQPNRCRREPSFNPAATGINR